jgi:hypothetical protein
MRPQQQTSLGSVDTSAKCRKQTCRRHHVELGTRILTQLEQFDQATRDAIPGRHPRFQ